MTPVLQTASVATVAAVPLLAQLGGAWSLKHLLIVAGVVAVLVVVVTQGLGWRIPSWLITVGWICLAVLVGILAINFLLSL